MDGGTKFFADQIPWNAKMQYTSTNLKKPVAEITQVAQHSDNCNGELNMNEKKGEEFMEGTTFIF